MTKEGCNLTDKNSRKIKMKTTLTGCNVYGQQHKYS